MKKSKIPPCQNHSLSGMQHKSESDLTITGLINEGGLTGFLKKQRRDGKKCFGRMEKNLSAADLISELFRIIGTVRNLPLQKK
jgi:hypothetical protein